MSRVGGALRRTLKRLPVSMRRLAEASGLTHGALRQARDGEFNLRRESVRAIIHALRGWSATFGEQADELEAALEDDTRAKEESDG